MGCAVSSFQFIFTKCKMDIAFLTKIKVKTIFTFITNSYNRHLLATMTFYVLPNLLPWLYNQFNMMSLMIMTSNFQFFNIQRSREVTILTHTKVNTVSTNKACPYNWAHIATHTFLIIVCCKSISQKGQFNTVKRMIMTKYCF